MHRSISLILPVHNAQAWLVSTAEMALDELAQLSENFEVLVIDDGSTDDTHALASELMAEFPQIRLLRQPLQYGQEAAEQLGIEMADGDFVIIPDHAESLCAGDIHQLWRVRNDPSLVMVVNPQASSSLHEGASRYRFDRSGDRARVSHASTRRGRVRMIRKDAMAQLGQPKADWQSEPIVVSL